MVITAEPPATIPGSPVPRLLGILTVSSEAGNMRPGPVEVEYAVDGEGPAVPSGLNDLGLDLIIFLQRRPTWMYLPS